MQFSKVTDEERSLVGNVGQPDTPNLTTSEMQEVMDSLPNLGIDKFNNHIDELLEATTESITSPGDHDHYPTVKAVVDFIGDGTGAEIVDAREDVSGVTHDSLGDAIRSQITGALNAVQDEQTRATTAEGLKINKPSQEGTAGQVLKTNGDGTTDWDNVPTTQEIDSAVTEYFEEHPEAIPESINGLTSRVVDLENQNGTETLATEAQTLSGAVNELHNKTESVMFYFPSLAAEGYSALSGLMIVNGKSVLFDCGATTAKVDLFAFYTELYEAGIFTNLDYIIISHYHFDHIGNLEEILLTFPHNNCKAYLPMSPSGYYAGSDATSILNDRTVVIDILTAAGVSYTEVSEDTNVTVVDNLCTIELFNSNADAYTYYAANTTRYNDYSMVSLVKVGSIYAMFPGDIEGTAEGYIVSQRSLPKLFLYTINHHGYQRDDNLVFMNQILPEYGVATLNPDRQRSAYGLIANYAVRHICSSAYSRHVFCMGKESGYIVSGIEVNTLHIRQNVIDLYVNNEYTGDVHDGTKDHPFTQINEALMFVHTDRGVETNIYVKATETVYNGFTVRVKPNVLNIIGDEVTETYPHAKIKAAVIYSSDMVSLSYLEFTETTDSEIASNAACVHIDKGYTAFSDCVFNPNNQSSSVALYLREAHVYMNACGVKNVLTLASSNRFCWLETNGITFENVTYCYRLMNCEVLIRNVDSATNITNYLVSSNTFPMQPVRISLPSSANIDNFKALLNYNSYGVQSLSFVWGGYCAHIVGRKLMIDTTPIFNGRAVNNESAVNNDLNEITVNGIYTFNSSAAHIPVASKAGVLLVLNSSSSTFQLAMVNDSANMNMFVRKTSSGTFGAWSKYTASAV